MALLSRKIWFALPTILLVVALAVSCAPATNSAVVGVEGVDVGNTSPPFSMRLEDGTEVSLKSLVEEKQAVHLFWFATW